MPTVSFCDISPSQERVRIDFSLAAEFTDDLTQMTDYYGDCLSEETHM